ncbi:MAG: hypothetical protein AABW79_01745 [Nanoarchaeota archaeon]
MEFYLVPRWFFGFDIALEMLFAFITFFVAAYALYMYRISAERDCKLLGFGFISIALSYVTWGILNFFLLTSLDNSNRVLVIENLNILGFFVLYGHIIFMLAGLATLAYLTFKTRSYRVYSLFVSLPIIMVIFSKNAALSFYFVSALLLFYITLHYMIKYSSRKRQTTLFVLIGFIFLLIGAVGFTFATLFNGSYVAGHMLQLLGYLFILIGFIKTVRA